MFEQVGDNVWMLTSDIEVNIGAFDFIRVKRGTLTDFATIPKFARWLIDTNDNDIAIPALVHDVLVHQYKHGDNVVICRNVFGVEKVVDREIDWNQAARIMRNLMYMRRAPGWKRFVVYWALRVYGLWMKKSG